MKKIIFFLLILINASAVAQTLEDHWWIPDGEVKTIAKNGNTVYLGGNFQNIGPNTPNGVGVSLSTALPVAGFAKPNGQVSASAPDGQGGWYIGGTFTMVAGQPRNRLARINSDGSLHAWNPNADGTISSLAISGNIVYAAGSFTAIGAATRNRIAAIDGETGLATPWNPDSNNTVRTIAIEGSTVYAGGQFTTIGGQPRNRIAALDVTTGLATSWNPNANTTVMSIAVNSGTVYAGGAFTTIGGQTRNRIAALDNTGSATPWNPNAGNTVASLAVISNTVYAGGSFSTIGGQTRSWLAALDAATGLATSWNPLVSGAVETIVADNNVIYAGGTFALNGGVRRNLAAIDAATGTATSWNPSVNGTVRSISISNGVLYAGGNFTSMGTIARRRMVALNATTGEPTSWDPAADSEVNALLVSGSTLYAGGSFTTIGGQPRNRIAAIDGTTGLATAWNPAADGTVSALATDGSTLYAGGSFITIGGQSRYRIAALNMATGNATEWNPAVTINDAVKTIVLDGSTIYIGGDFTFIGGVNRNRLAAFHNGTGNMLTWNPNANGPVDALAIKGSTIYAGGNFNTIGGVTRFNIAALDASTGVVATWNPLSTGRVYSIKTSGNRIYAGGNFSNIGGQARQGVASIDDVTATATAWNARLTGTLNTIIIDGNYVFLGGNFISNTIIPVQYFAVYNTCTLTATATQTNATAYGLANGTATAVPAGGTTPYTYAWNTTPAQTTATATGLAAGTYTVTVTDANNCVKTVNVTITQPAMCAVTTTWDGTAWSNGTPTSNGYTAVIEGDFMSTGNIAACSLTINSGAITINSGHNLTIKGAVTVSGGSLTFEDNANLIQADDVANSGNITYKKLGSNLHYLDYTLWSSPTNGTQTLKQFSAGTLDERFYVYNTALGVWSNHTSPSGIFGSNPNAVTFAEAKGYLIRMPEGQDPAQTAVFEGVFTGEPNNGDISIAAPAGFNAIGNPYPSPINIHNFIDENEGLLDNEGALYFWRKTNNATATTYSTINKLAYVANDADGGDTGTGYFNLGQEASWVISPAQGFLVKSLGGSINFTNSMRKPVNTGQFFRTANNDSDETLISRYWLNITGANNSFGQMAVAYTPAATLGLDYGLDARLVNDGALALYSLAATKNLAIQARPEFVNTDVVPLGYKATTAGTYTITLNQFDGLFTGNQGIYIKDNITGTVYDIKASPYSFTTPDGTFNNRLEVVYANGALGTNNPAFDEAGIVIYKQGNTLYADSQNAIISSIMVFDITGRLLYNVQDVNALHAYAMLNVQQQVLVVQVKTVSGQVVSKKVLF